MAKLGHFREGVAYPPVNDNIPQKYLEQLVQFSPVRLQNLSLRWAGKGPPPKKDLLFLILLGIQS